MTFTVFVDDNYHYMDESERYKKGEYESYEAALSVCKKIVDEYLASAFEEGMDVADLIKIYVLFGDDPFIVPSPEGERFSARDYARERCAEMCDATQDPDLV
jgi:hypothetical protein